MRPENHPVPELISNTVDGTDPPFTTASGDSMLQEIHSAYGVSQDQKLQEAKKQPVQVAKKPSPPTLHPNLAPTRRNCRRLTLLIHCRYLGEKQNIKVSGDRGAGRGSFALSLLVTCVSSNCLVDKGCIVT